ncbi:hypothetical protein F5883DRAFT_666604 [Diaporthe sp. PMI_573]|nr:hypothetical protein F5883DRAFT_666604 [Diaporthaceae sp. PMI_573]
MCDRKQDNSDLRSVNTATSFSDDGMMTPTSSCFERYLDTAYIPSVPCPGKIYKIHLRDTEKVIMVTEGRVVVQSMDQAKLGGGWHWVCGEKGNWLGFRNHVTGTYLGCTLFPGVHAYARQQTLTESFCVRHHPRGGYLLLVNSKEGGGMDQIACASDGKNLERVAGGGALWMFEEV